jgi:serine/threonine protein kinase
VRVVTYFLIYFSSFFSFFFNVGGEYRGMEVAVKHLQFNNVNERAITDFHTELAVMKSLRHPNIVLAMGACVHPVCLVTEFCANGSLFDVLHNDNIVLSGRMKLKLAYDIVSIFKISTSICQPFVVEDF